MADSDISTFLCIPSELLELIYAELDLDALKNLRLSCKHLGHALLPHVLRSITIDLNQHTLEIEMAKLRAMASGESATSLGTQELTVRSLSPTFDPSYSCTWSYRDGQIVRNGPEPVIPPAARQADEELRGLLFVALMSLKNVRKLSWFSFYDDNEWSQNIVMSAMKTLPSLRSLTIDAKYLKIPLNLDEFTSLHTISLLNSNDSDHSEEIMDTLAKMVANSPQLTSIELLPQSHQEVTSPKHSLHHLVKYMPNDAAVLRLRHLGLSESLLRLDSTTLPHFRSLKSLQLTGITDPYSPFYNNPSNLDEVRQVGSSLEDFWRTMANEGIWLEEIDHVDVCPEFQDYLMMYSGLRSLKLTPDPWSKEPAYVKAQAERFFAIPGPLLQHSQTLEELFIRPRYEGGWCFDVQSPSESLSACVHLKKLGVGIISEQLRMPYRPPGRPKQELPPLFRFYQLNETAVPEENAIQCLIDTVTSTMPHLEALELNTAKSESSRGAWCGTGEMQRTESVHRQMIQTALAYTAPMSFQRLPSLTIRRRGSDVSNPTFIAERKVDGSGVDMGLVYVALSDK